MDPPLPPKKNKNKNEKSSNIENLVEHAKSA